MSFSPLLTQLIEALRCLPGVGPKSAQRMAIHLLDKDRPKACQLVSTLSRAIEQVGRCELCRTLCEESKCRICNSDSRDASSLCVVESPIDILVIEQTGTYNGHYFVLTGLLSPLDGVGPNELQLEDFNMRLQDAAIEEVILATSPSVEGEATAQYLTKWVRHYGKRLTRLAYGIPYGGELEFVDSHTLTHAFTSRQLL